MINEMLIVIEGGSNAKIACHSTMEYHIPILELVTHIMNDLSRVYFTFTNGGNILPGTPAEVFLLGEVRENVISVPVSALSEQQGRFFVFRRLGDECYEKVPVTLGANDGTRVEIKDGIKAGDNIVTKGTVSVRLAESSGVVPEGHSHNH